MARSSVADTVEMYLLNCPAHDFLSDGMALLTASMYISPQVSGKP